jgi:hypothetical protein
MSGYILVFTHDSPLGLRIKNKEAIICSDLAQKQLMYKIIK